MIDKDIFGWKIIETKKFAFWERKKMTIKQCIKEAIKEILLNC